MGSNLPQTEPETEEVAYTGTLTMRLYHRLHRDIVTGVLAPGTKLKIEEIRKAYEVGSSPVREALNLLTSFGFVERLEHRGFQVRPISAAEYDDLTRVRCWVEELALRQSIKSGDEKWEEEIALALFRLSRANKNREFAIDPNWEVHHKHFHMTLISGCGSPMLLEYCNQLYDQGIRYRQIAGLASMPERDSNAEHNELAHAVLDRNADLAVELLCAQYRRTGQYLMGQLFS